MEQVSIREAVSHIKGLLTLILLLALALTSVHAQSGKAGYQFLNIPVSAHSSALGGSNISIIEDDITLMFNNPSLLPNVSSNTANFDVTTYISSGVKLSTGFSRKVLERGTWAVGAQVLTYGKMTETSVTGEELGSFSAADINIQGSFAYLLSDHWSAGITYKLLFQNYANYNAVGMGVDLGVNYFNEDVGLSMSLVCRNLGGEVKPLYDIRQRLPINLALGFSQDLRFIPVRLSLTFDDLTTWKHVNFWEHMIIGADVFPTRFLWLSLGYNIRRGNEMKVLGSTHWAGFNIGAGIDIKKIKFGFAYSRYHIAANSFLFNISYPFGN